MGMGKYHDGHLAMCFIKSTLSIREKRTILLLMLSVFTFNNLSINYYNLFEINNNNK